MCHKNWGCQFGFTFIQQIVTNVTETIDSTYQYMDMEKLICIGITVTLMNAYLAAVS